MLLNCSSTAIFHLAAVLLQLVVDGELQARLGTLEDVVEVVAVDVDEAAVLQARQLLGGITGEITQHAHHERQFLFLDGIPFFDVVSDLHPRAAHPVKRVLSAFGHVSVSPFRIPPR
jgi:hypothetical protein